MKIILFFFKNHQFDESETTCCKVLEKDPSALEALICRSEVYISRKQFDLAKRDLLIAKQIHPNDMRAPRLLQQLAQIGI